MSISTYNSFISSLLIIAFTISPLGAVAQASILDNLNTTDLTKSDLFTKDFLGGGYAMLDCFGTTSSILDSIQGMFGGDDVLGGDKVAVDDKTQNLKTECLDVAAQVNAQKTVASMSKSIFNWTETGNGGNPLYVKDFGKYLKSIDTQEVGILKNTFTTEILNDPTKLPFAKDAVKTLQSSEKSKDDIVKKLTYTGPNKEVFSKSFREGGGWNSWLKATQNPNNNPLGFNLQVGEEIQKRKEEAKENVKEELKQTNFLSVKKCVDPNYKDDGTPLSDDDKRAGKTNICTKWEVQTPGSIVKEQAAEAANSSLKLALNVDEKGKQLNVMFASLLTQLFNQGFNTLGNKASSVIGNVAISKIPTYGDNSGEVDESGTDWFDTVWIGGVTPRDIPNIIKNQKIIIEKLPERKRILTELITQVQELDYCIPGPHPLWEKDLGDFLGAKLKEYGQQVEPDFGEKFAKFVGENGSLTSGTGPIGLVVKLLMDAHVFNYYSRDELNMRYSKNSITDTNKYFEYIKKHYDNPASYKNIPDPDNDNVFDNSDVTISKLQELYSLKSESDRQFINTTNYRAQIEKNSLYISLTKKQMARMQDICVQTHKLYVRAFNRQRAERISWESWNRKSDAQKNEPQVVGYHINLKDETGTYRKNVPNPTSKLYSYGEARSKATTFKVGRSSAVTPSYESSQIGRPANSDTFEQSNIVDNFDQALFDKMFTEVKEYTTEPKKVPPLPSFSEYAMNCTGNVGSFANPTTIAVPVYNPNIADTQ